jgi:hypothetical protein
LFRLLRVTALLPANTLFWMEAHTLYESPSTD